MEAEAGPWGEVPTSIAHMWEKVRDAFVTTI